MMNGALCREWIAMLPPPMGECTYVYALVDPRTLDVRYVGKSKTPADRLRNHINETPRGTHKSNWLKSLKVEGLEPGILILERIEGAWPWQESERHWIARGRAMGWPLTNATDGGDGVSGLAPDRVERIAAAWRGRKHRPETIEKLKRARAARVTSPETRRRMSVALTGRVITWGARISEAVRKLTPEDEVDIRRRIAAGERMTDLAREYGVHRTSVAKVKKGTYRGPQ